MTASTLYEAVEPHVIWKQLLTSIISELADGEVCEVCETHRILEVFLNFSAGNPFVQVHIEDLFIARRRDSICTSSHRLLSDCRYYECKEPL